MREPAILVIRNDDRFSRLLREAGFEVLNLELISTQPVADLSDLDDKLGRINEYDGLFFTSPAAAEVFVRESSGRVGFSGSIYALGDRAKRVLEKAGVDVVSRDQANTAGELISLFEKSEIIGKKFLFICGDKSLRTIPERLKGRATIDETVVYETKAVPLKAEEIEDVTGRLKNRDIDWVCFFSPSGVERFAEVFQASGYEARGAAIGKTTAQKARDLGFQVEVVSPRSNAEDFARTLIEHIKNIE
jgi:uroporphyrinogen-III synthase